MPNIAIVYYSQTGNTEKMAQAILEGAQREPGIEGKLLIDFEASRATVGDVDAIIVGTPTYHHDMPRGIKQFFENLVTQSTNFAQKIGASFGSYGWSGEAPRLALEIMEHKFAMNVIKPPLLIKYRPDNTALIKCQEFGKKIVEQLVDFEKNKM
ncbi:MAG: NAD(P)H-dependent oxidoreductase [Candidatus Bathyarchaeota archaeon]|nr:NAD(P)H-dependent oxidoreductase [Candidatus Bathyarchaeota archaeon]